MYFRLNIQRCHTRQDNEWVLDEIRIIEFLTNHGVPYCDVMCYCLTRRGESDRSWESGSCEKIRVENTSPGVVTAMASETNTVNSVLALGC